MANVVIKENERSLHDVCEIYQLEHLLRGGANVNERNVFDETPLLSALRRDVDFKLIKEFLNQGADVNSKDCWGISPLYCAVARHGKNLKLIKLLLDQGADIESGKRLNDRFLDHTVTHNQSCIKLLIMYKFLKNAKLLDSFISPDAKLKKDYHKEYKAIVDLDLKPSCYDYLGSFLDSCAIEVIRMKTTFIDGELSLFHFMSATSIDEIHKDSVVKGILIEKVCEELSVNDYLVFKDIMISKIGQEQLLNKITELLLKHAINKSFPYQVVLHCLSKYLTDEDLLSIVKALL